MEDPEEDPSKGEEEPMEEEDPKEDPSEGKEELMAEEDPKEDPVWEKGKARWGGLPAKES